MFDCWLNFALVQNSFRWVELKCRLPKGQAEVLIFVAKINGAATHWEPFRKEAYEFCCPTALNHYSASVSGYYRNEREAGPESLPQWRLGSFEGTGFNQWINPSIKQKCLGSTLLCTGCTNNNIVVVLEIFACPLPPNDPKCLWRCWFRPRFPLLLAMATCSGVAKHVFPRVPGTLDGALGLLLPMPEKTYRRLHMLQTKLIDCIPHIAGLNPKAFRSVELSLHLLSSALFIVDVFPWEFVAAVSIPPILDSWVQLSISTAPIWMYWCRRKSRISCRCRRRCRLSCLVFWHRSSWRLSLQ